MATIYGSPGKSNLIASRMQEYMKNLDNDSQPVLKNSSSSRINSSSNIHALVESSKPVGLQYSDSSDKENLRIERTGLSSPHKTSNITSSLFTSPTRNTNNTKVDDSILTELSAKDRDYYEFLCRVGEAKEWIENIIGESLPSILDLATTKSMSDGVYLAKLVAKIKPDLVQKIIPAGSKLMYAHTQNINIFLQLVDYLKVPDLFRFELNDLYDCKNIPKVFETIHAMASVLNNNYDHKFPAMKTLTGQIRISSEDIKVCQRKLPGVHAFRSFNQFISRPSSPRKSPQKGILDVALEKSPAKVNEAKSFANESPKTPSRYPSAIVHDMSTQNLALPELQLPSLSFPDTVNPTKLTYSPDRTFSYYSPGVSRTLSYRTEEIGYYNKKRYQNNYDFGYYDTFRYASSQYSPRRQQRMTESEFLDTVTNLQALLKGLNVRYDLHLKRLTLEHYNTGFNGLQSLCKAAVVRRKYLQLDDNQEQLEKLAILQGVMRGVIKRNGLDYLRLRIIKSEQIVGRFKAASKGAAIRKLIQKRLSHKVTYHGTISHFQSIIKASSIKACLSHQTKLLGDASEQVSKLQSFVRGRIIRLQTVLRQGGQSQIKLQAMLKGTSQRSILRRKANQIESLSLLPFSAILKGYLVRKAYTIAPTAISSEITQFNAIIKGMLARFAFELITDIIERNNIEKFQSKVLGYLVRRNIDAAENYYNTNTISVVMIQKNIRRYQLQNAYKELLSSACPGLGVVQKFVHILNQSDNDTFCTKLQTIKKNINDKNDEIREIQENIEAAIRKKDTLEKRRINVSKFLSKAGHQQLEAQLTYVDNNDVSRHLQGLYGKLGFLLQVDSFYWKLLSVSDPKFCVTNLPKIFAPLRGSINLREQSLFIKIVGELFIDEMENSKSSVDFYQQKHHTWSSLFKNYLISFKANDMTTLFSQLYKYLDSDLTDFESNPSLIYAKLYPSQHPVASNIAIENSATNAQFVKNMTSLWAAVEIVCAILDKIALTSKHELRYLASKVYRSAANQYGEELLALKSISRLIIDNYLTVALKNREDLDPSNQKRGYSSKANVLLSILDVVFGFNEFDGFYSPLNQYLFQSQDQFVGLLRGLLMDPDEDREFETIVYKDMANNTRPSLTIYHQTFIKIIKKLDSVSKELPHDDPILDILADIAVEFDRNSVSGQTLLTILLDPTAYRVTLNDDRSDLMYREAKQGLCYLMQIEDGCANLTDLLVSETFPEDEIRFQNLLKNNTEIETILTERHSSTLTYSEFKRFLMHRIKELNVLGIVDKTNDYQSLLVDIANTIKSRSCIKDLNYKEMLLMTSVYGFLQNKQNNLKLLLEALEQAVKKSIKEIQTLRKFEPLKKKSGIGHKLKDVYQKAQNKSQNIEKGMNFKWSSRQLMEKNVLVKIGGEDAQTASVSFFGSSGSKSATIDFKLSTRDGEIFGIEMLDNKRHTDGDLQNIVKFNELLEKEVQDNKATISLFGKRHTVFNVSKLLDLIVETFYVV